VTDGANLAKQPEFPEGLEFLKLAESVAAACGNHTDQRLPEMGKSCPECLHNLGTMLSILYRVGSCHGRCRGGDHLIEYILGRTCSTALSALSLLRQGYYDEALSLARSIGETANLLTSFVKLPGRLEEWKRADARTRLREFSPVKVRLTLEGAKVPLPVDEERYRQLSSTATHVSPSIQPQLHNIAGIPTLGAMFQDIGAMVSLNETAWATGWAGVAGARLMELPAEEYSRIKGAAVDLLASVGGVTILKSEEIRREYQQKLVASLEGTDEA
jgi:hypothetical protein